MNFHLDEKEKWTKEPSVGLSAIKPKYVRDELLTEELCHATVYV